MASTNVDNINNFLNTGSKNASSAEKARKTLTGNFEDFLLLLTTQLKNQDPTAPLDSNQFTQQLATLSSVEQQISTNSNLEKLISLSNNTQLNNVVSYIGRAVEADGNQGMLQDGVASFAYNLSAEADKVEVTISDSTGRMVFRGFGSKDAGRNAVVWDGVNSVTGQDMPNGIYKIAVKATDSTGKDIAATTYTSGRVTSVETRNGTMTVMVGDIPLAIDKVKSIREVPLT